MTNELLKRVRVEHLARCMMHEARFAPGSRQRSVRTAGEIELLAACLRVCSLMNELLERVSGISYLSAGTHHVRFVRSFEVEVER